MSQTAPSHRPLFRLRTALRIAIVAILTTVFVGSVLWRRRGVHQPLALAVHPHLPRWDLMAAAGPIIQLHAAAATLALAIGIVVLIGVKGSALHKRLGWGWVAAMATTAVSSLFVKVLNPGHWSYIHFLSGWVIIALPIGIAAIRRRNVGLHQRMMTGVFVGGLVIAGALTFAPGRLMFRVFLG